MIRIIKGDTRSLDKSSLRPLPKYYGPLIVLGRLCRVYDRYIRAPGFGALPRGL